MRKTIQFWLVVGVFVSVGVIVAWAAPLSSGEKPLIPLSDLPLEKGEERCGDYFLVTTWSRDGQKRFLFQFEEEQGVEITGHFRSSRFRLHIDNRKEVPTMEHVKGELPDNFTIIIRISASDYKRSPCLQNLEPGTPFI